MKTKPVSIRFDEQDLLLAQNLSGIKKPQKLVDLLIAEYVKPLKGSQIELPKDFMNPKKIAIVKEDGTVEELKFQKPKPSVKAKKDDPLESFINYKAPDKATYDSDFKSKYLMDEAGQWATPTHNNEEIQKQIDALEKEKNAVPKDYSVIGKKVWINDRQKKIDELKKLLK